ncbi:hypothetical protein M427DRAFT_342551 [Gonapodya prolifera JEL478]|uniref:Uncharacterized protein n=1 Tax=Gonapodya prolifera (strain JEL478) TaxID=1344416 RepID=A0A139AVS6_GONPJ|nr:hypothetical protein M427DRAFT_342551 [Gonapodya prolifera JEL478]|eukprot:KXS20683.1 hypothetical protein M427DRAFT_342551 [Gonapodya prolifera JEL478]
MAPRGYSRLSAITLYACLSFILLVASLVSAAHSRTKREMEDLAFREVAGGPAISIPVVESQFSRRQSANLTCPSGQRQCINVCIDNGLSCCESLKAYCFKGGDFCCSKEMCCGLGEVCVGGPFNSTCEPIPVEPKFNSSCSGNAQCPMGLFCTNGKCGCPSTKVPCNNNTKCCPALTFGQACTDGTECMNLLQCSQGLCSCPTSVSFACEGNTTCCTTNTLSSVVMGSAVPTTTAGANSGSPGLSVDSSGEQKSSVPLGAILGGTAAALLCTIALAAYFLARRRRQQSDNADIKVLRKVKKVGTDGTIYEEVVTTFEVCHMRDRYAQL